MSAIELSVALDFSPSPAGRFERDGPFPGEVFRDKLLVPSLQKYDQVVVELDGTAGMGSSFLEEAFGGLVRLGFSESDLRNRLQIRSSRKSYEERIWGYIVNAAKVALRA